jgi:hypothetical protein
VVPSAVKPLAGAVKAAAGARALKTFMVEVRDGAVWLVDWTGGASSPTDPTHIIA